jgi:hypothetical protein
MCCNNTVYSIRLNHLYYLINIRLHVSATVGHHQAFSVTSLNYVCLYNFWDLNSFTVDVRVKFLVTKILVIKFYLLNRISHVKFLFKKEIHLFLLVYVLQFVWLFLLSCIGLVLRYFGIGVMWYCSLQLPVLLVFMLWSCWLAVGSVVGRKK